MYKGILRKEFGTVWTGWSWFG